MKRVLLALLGALALAVALVVGVVIPGLDRELDALVGYRPPTTCHVLDAHGISVDEFALTRREWVDLSALPPIVGQAIIAAEDRRFREHAGVDPAGIARAMRTNFEAGRVEEGGSTLTQQLVKNLLVGSEQTYARKAEEALLAWRLERRMSKDELLELYLNYVYLGSGNYGVEAASQDYFGVSARELSAGQAALLAGLVPAPSRFSPRRDPVAATERQGLVLAALVQTGGLTEAEAAVAAAPIEPIPRTETAPDAGQAYRTVVRREGRRLFGDQLPFTHGLRVHTAYDPSIQLEVERAIAAATQGVELRQGHPAGHVQGAAVVVDNATGAIVAVSGGNGVPLEGFVRATQARRQPGSSFKPYVYGAALVGGLRQTDTVVDAPLSLPAGGGRTWSPSNYSGGYAGPLPLRDALARSLNTVAVRLAMQTGTEAVAVLAADLGVATPLREDLTLALGSSEVTVLDQAVAYAAIARLGEARDPVFLTEVRDARDQPVGRAGDVVVLGDRRIVLPGAPRQVLDPGIAWELVDMLQGVVSGGTGRRAQVDDQDRFGKTGTTSGFADAWFVGSTPTHTVAVWIGVDDRTSLGDRETGGRAALPAWIRIVDALGRPTPSRFIPPDGVVLVPWRGQRLGFRQDRVPRDLLAPLPVDAGPLPPWPSR
jgi:penicillin-binding protein 1A